MSHTESQDLELLVSAITERVRARLTGGHAEQATAAPLPAVRADGRQIHAPNCMNCELPIHACEGCGLNPMTAPRQWMPPASIPDAAGMARWIDHTLLAATASREEIEKVCKEALKHRFFSVCVNSGNVRLAASFLQGSDVKVCAVVGFPLGAAAPGAKAFEAREAVRCGAHEIDMVLNIGALRSRDYALVTDDIRKVVLAVPGKVVKVILETGMLDPTQKIIACALSKVAGAAFVKTSTGFGPGGATVEDIALMRSIVGPDMGVKASGGVRTYKDAVAMLQAGASRLGASSSVRIVTNTTGSSAGY
jgi:deoxyribose-phosphate aldolase